MSRPYWQRNWFFFFRRGRWSDEKINCDRSAPKTCLSGWAAAVGRFLTATEARFLEIHCGSAQQAVVVFTFAAKIDFSSAPKGHHRGGSCNTKQLLKLGRF
jgi:hypothetical protein